MAQTVHTMDTHMVSEESNKVVAHKDTFKRLISTFYLVLKYVVTGILKLNENIVR